MLVDQSVAAEFTGELVREVGTLVVGEPSAGEDVEIVAGFEAAIRAVI